MGLGGEYLGVSVPAPLALHAGREPTCGVNSRAAVNHRRLSTRVRRTWARVGSRRLETAGRAGTSVPKRGTCARARCCVSWSVFIPFDVRLSCGDRPASGSSAGHSAEQHSRYLLPDRQRHVRQNPQRSTITPDTGRRYGTGSSPRTLYPRAPSLSSHRLI